VELVNRSTEPYAFLSVAENRHREVPAGASFETSDEHAEVLLNARPDEFVAADEWSEEDAAQLAEQLGQEKPEEDEPKPDEPKPDEPKPDEPQRRRRLGGRS
jgi:hypothetical protein